MRWDDSGDEIEQALHGVFRKRRSELYWLAFLLTGRPTPSVDVVSETLEGDSGSNGFFESWMLRWSRKVVVSKALGVIRAELAASRHRIEGSRLDSPAIGDLPARDWSLAADSAKPDLERALLAIDVFPRCALLLTVFEKLPIADAATLLDAGQELVNKAKVIGLRELTRNLARNAGWTSKSFGQVVFQTEGQHA